MHLLLSPSPSGGCGSSISLTRGIRRTTCRPRCSSPVRSTAPSSLPAWRRWSLGTTRCGRPSLGSLATRSPCSGSRHRLRCRCPGIDLAGLPEEAREAEALAPRRRGGAAAVRSGARALAACRAAAPGCRTPRRSLHDAPHGGRRLVGRSAGARAGGALPGVRHGGLPSPLAPLPVQYADFVLWQRESLRGAELESQLAFWRGALAGAPAVLELPADRPRPARASGRGGAVAATLGAEHVDALKAVGRQAGATPFMTLLAAYYALLHRLTGEVDLVVGTPVANRRRPELEGLIGFFANTLVLRAGLPLSEQSRPLPACSPGSARRRSPRTRIRTCRSSGWSRSWRRSGASPIRRSSRCRSCCTAFRSRSASWQG